VSYAATVLAHHFLLMVQFATFLFPMPKLDIHDSNCHRRLPQQQLKVLHRGFHN
jgi:hypothetical protein